MQTVTESTSSKQSLSPTQAKKRKKDERINSALRFALFMHTGSQERWEKLIADGAHDNEIWHALLSEFGSGGSSQDDTEEQFAYQGGKGDAAQPKFWFSQGTHYTNEKPTLAGARLVKRVRELLQIPPLQLASSEVALSSSDPASPEMPPELAEKGWSFEKTARSWRCKLAGSNLRTLYVKDPAEAITYAKELQKSIDDGIIPSPEKASAASIAENNDAPAIPSPDESTRRVLDLAFLADLEDEQKGRWATLQEYDRLIEASTKKRDTKRLQSEQTAIVEDYEAAWDEAVKALDNNADIVQEVRDRIEGTGSTIVETGDESGSRNGGCPPDCGHTDEEHAAFDAGVKAGEQGLDDCPYDDRDLGTAWHIGFSVGEGNRITSATPAESADAVSSAQDLAAGNGDARSQPTTSFRALPFTRELECELTDDDLLTKLSELTGKLTEKDSVEQELKEVSAGYKGRIKTLDREIHTLTRTVTQRRETREVECRERFNFDDYKVEVIRLDTFDVVESRQMTARERQQTLPSI